MQGAQTQQAKRRLAARYFPRSRYQRRRVIVAALGRSHALLKRKLVHHNRLLHVKDDQDQTHSLFGGTKWYLLGTTRLHGWM